MNIQTNECDDYNDSSDEDCATDESLEESHRNVNEYSTIQELARKETDSIRVWRAIVAFMIISVGAFASISTYFYLRNKQTDECNISVCVS